MIDIGEAEAKLKEIFDDNFGWDKQYILSDDYVKLNGIFDNENYPYGIYFKVSVYDSAIFFEAKLGKFLDYDPVILEDINKYNMEEFHLAAYIDKNRYLSLRYTVNVQDIELIEENVYFFFDILCDEGTVNLYNVLEDLMIKEGE